MKRVGALDTSLKYAQDMEMWLRASSASDVGRVDGPDQALHRDHEASMSVTIGAGALTDLHERARVFEALTSNANVSLPDGPELLKTARVALAREALDRACRAYDRGRALNAPVDGLVEFAFGVFPEAGTLREWRALQRRRRVGAARSKYVPSFFLRALVRRFDDEVSYARWVRCGL